MNKGISTDNVEQRPMKVFLMMTLGLMIVGGSGCTPITTTPDVVATSDSSAETRKALVRRFYEEVWNRGEMTVVEELFAPQYTRHDPVAGTTRADHEVQRQSAGAQRTMFPDLRLHIDFMIAEGDLVAARWTIQGTNTGPRGQNPPTGKPVKFSGINIFRFEEGKVVELWNHRDDLSYFRQLDQAPPMR